MIIIKGWDTKKKTMLRFIKKGDIFCFKLNDSDYCFGRIIEKFSGGHVAEIFKSIKHEAKLSQDEIISSSRMFNPIVLDSYGLFDKKIYGDWQIIGNQKDYKPDDYDNIFFYYGAAPNALKLENIKGELVKKIEVQETEGLQRSGPLGDQDIKIRVMKYLKH